MEGSFIERQAENTVRDMFAESGVRAFRFVKSIADMQGGKNTIENYQLLGKRVLIVGGVVLVVQAAVSVVTFAVTRRAEKRRMEKVARRVYEEESHKEEAQRKA